MISLLKVIYKMLLRLIAIICNINCFVLLQFNIESSKVDKVGFTNNTRLYKAVCNYVLHNYILLNFPWDNVFQTKICL